MRIFQKLRGRNESADSIRRQPSDAPTEETTRSEEEKVQTTLSSDKSGCCSCCSAEPEMDS